MSIAGRMRDEELKARYCLELILATQRLVEATADPYRARVLARSGYIFVGEFLLFGRRWRKQLAREEDRERQASARQADRALRTLDQKWQPHSAVRAHVAAKRQAIASGRRADLFATLEMWQSIDAAVLAPLTKSATAAYEILSAATPGIQSVVVPSAPAAVASSLAALDGQVGAGRVRANAGTYASTRNRTLAVTGGGELGRRIGQVNDVADQFATVAAVAPAVAPGSAHDRVLRAALVNEMSQLLDLTVGPPAGFPVSVKPLVEVCRTLDAEEGARVLEQLAATIDLDTRTAIRTCRNLYGAHVDRAMPFVEVLATVDALDVVGLIHLGEHVRRWLEAAACSELRLATLLFDEFTTPEDDQIPAGSGVDSSARRPAAMPPPEVAESPYVLWVDASTAPFGSATVAGLLSGRTRRLRSPP